jgi:twitching motility protein PilT
VAVEIMLGSPAVRNLIREGKFYQLPNVIRTSHDEGMITMDEALVELYRQQVISRENLFNYCQDASEVEKLISSSPGSQKRKKLIENSKSLLF